MILDVADDKRLPEFDNLYLDMNGIIHHCSHPNDDDPTFRITETEIFIAIFSYIGIINLIKITSSTPLNHKKFLFWQ